MEHLQRSFRKLFATLILSSSTGQVAAIGLGEIDTHSALGQTLNASIALTGDGKSLSNECFSLLPSQDRSLHTPSNAVLSLEAATGGKARLRIRTPRTIDEPVLGFAIQFDCEGSLKREYVVLLDPAPDESGLDGVVVSKAASNWISPAVPDAPMVEQAPAYQERPRKTSRRRPHSQARAHSASPLPRLMISGNRGGAESARHFLKLDTHLSLPGRGYSAPATEVELSDENTALMHKLGHLERQLIALQQRNAELQERVADPQATAPASATWHALPKQAAWGLLLLGLMLAGAGIAWLLHRRSARPAPGPWMPASPAVEPLVQQPPLPVRPAPLPDPFEIVSSTEVYDSLKDEVEVFVAHKHIDLAIQRLEEEIRHDPDASPVPWLLLLDLLRHEHRPERYNTVRKSCARHFNLNMPSYAGTETANKHGLESYAQVVGRLVSLWPGAESADYLDRLLHDTRRGIRSGFDLESFQEIMFLRELLKHREFEEAPTNIDFPEIRGLDF